MWIIGTVYVTILAINDFSLFWVIWLIFGYAGVILAPTSLFAVRRKELICTTTDGIEVHYKGILPKKVFIEKDNLESVTLEKYVFGPDSFGETGQEAVWTLNIFQKKGWRRRIMLASFAHPEEKHKIYGDLVKFLKEGGYTFKEKNDYAQNTH